jgi:DNA-binding GntR family transcriptional regulator
LGGYGVSDGSAPFERVRARNLADEVASRLYDAVVRGVLRPGEKVVEAALSRQMDVSRAPIREGIRVLVERGLLVQIPRRGVFVREYGVRDIEEINELRLAIEIGALSRSLSGGYMLELDVLQNAFDARTASGGEGEIGWVLEREFAIHRAIVQLYPNDHFLRAFDNVSNELRVSVAGVQLRELSDAQLRREHEPLLRAIRTRDREQALALLTEAVNDFAVRVMQALSPREQARAAPERPAVAPLRARIVG